MMGADRETVVLDASVGVKWFKPEPGQEEALAFFEDSVAGTVMLAAPVHFVHEVLSVVGRHYAPGDIIQAWEHIKASGIAVLPLTDEVIAEAAHQCDMLGCSFYDALAPACAELLGGTLVSADERAHGAFPRLHLVCEA